MKRLLAASLAAALAMTLAAAAPAAAQSRDRERDVDRPVGTRFGEALSQQMRDNSHADRRERDRADDHARGRGDDRRRYADHDSDRRDRDRDRSRGRGDRDRDRDRDWDRGDRNDWDRQARNSDRDRRDRDRDWDRNDRRDHDRSRDRHHNDWRAAPYYGHDVEYGRRHYRARRVWVDHGVPHSHRHYFRWGVGSYYPYDYRRYVVVNFYDYHLPPPPRHHVWVCHDDGAYLVAVATGLIVGLALSDAYYY